MLSTGSAALFGIGYLDYGVLVAQGLYDAQVPRGINNIQFHYSPQVCQQKQDAEVMNQVLKREL